MSRIPTHSTPKGFCVCVCVCVCVFFFCSCVCVCCFLFVVVVVVLTHHLPSVEHRQLTVTERMDERTTETFFFFFLFVCLFVRSFLLFRYEVYFFRFCSRLSVNGQAGQ